MRRHLATLVAVLASLAPSCVAEAQEVDATLEAGVANVAYDQYSRSAAFVLAPALVLSVPRASLEARSALSLFEGGSRSAQAGGTGRVASVQHRGFSIEVVADGGTTLYNDVSPIIYGRGDLVARYRRNATWEVYVGPTLGFVADNTGRRRLTGATAGIWGADGTAIFGGRVTPARVGSRAYADTELWGGWARGRLELSGTAGVRAGGDQGAGARVWLNGGATVRMGARYAVVAGLGAYPADLVQGVPGGRFGTLAVRVQSRRRAPSTVAAPYMLARLIARPAAATVAAAAGAAAPATASDFDVRSAGGGWYRLRLRARSARQVELMGDFTNWDAVPFARRADGSWEVTIPLSTGSHRFNVRVDGGAWIVPSGVATVDDDYGGVVAVLSIL